MMITLTLLSSVFASWQRRDYYNDNRCAGDSQLNMQVFIPNVVCPRVNVPAEICEIKSTNSVYLSSEGTGCDNASATDVPYYPSRIIPGINYLTTNQYFNLRAVSTTCDITPNTQITQQTYAADGRCHVFERDTSFRATCDQNGATLQMCWDVNCQGCDAVIRLEPGCNPTLQGQPTRFICNTPEMIQQRNAAPSASATPSGSSATQAPASTNTKKANADIGLAGAGVGLLPLLLAL